MTDSDPVIATTATFECWFQLPELDKTSAQSGSPLKAFKQCLQQGNQILGQQFDNGVGAPVLVHARSWLIDQVLTRTWARFMGTESRQAALVAVGGYGRSELMPGSDVDLLILLPDDEGNRFDGQITELITFLWDIGLEVGHSVRTIEDCIEQSLADVTVVTNLMEARLLAGSEQLFRRMQKGIEPAEIWDSRKFFEVKSAEQRRRYKKYHDSAYNLEPNIKEGPGGLRDIQMIAWVANRHFGTASLQQLVDHGFLTRKEYET
ncbi:MAG: nucleotidyltransferase domain-containing protein, partial [Gammaproteobacteria bacterium]|nr:nucleotidyltransferase domain-containing protein [Gammaproteobacteria bacterium]